MESDAGCLALRLTIADGYRAPRLANPAQETFLRHRQCQQMEPLWDPDLTKRRFETLPTVPR